MHTYNSCDTFTHQCRCKKLDAIELEYERKIANASQEEAIELAQGLKEYREIFKVEL